MTRFVVVKRETADSGKTPQRFATRPKERKWLSSVDWFSWSARVRNFLHGCLCDDISCTARNLGGGDVTNPGAQNQCRHHSDSGASDQSWPQGELQLWCTRGYGEEGICERARSPGANLLDAAVQACGFHLLLKASCDLLRLSKSCLHVTQM